MALQLLYLRCIGLLSTALCLATSPQHHFLISDNISPVILKFTLSFVFQPTDNPTTNTIKFSTSSLTAWSALPICPATITSISGYFHNCTQNLNCVPYTPSNQSFRFLCIPLSRTYVIAFDLYSFILYPFLDVMVWKTKYLIRLLVSCPLIHSSCTGSCRTTNNTVDLSLCCQRQSSVALVRGFDKAFVAIIQ
jgi:hypothetical protein